MEEYENVNNNLKKLSKKFPNLAKLWINYLDLKKKNFEATLELVKKLIENIESNRNIKDLNQEILKNLNTYWIINNIFN